MDTCLTVIFPQALKANFTYLIKINKCNENLAYRKGVQSALHDCPGHTNVKDKHLNETDTVQSG